MPMGKRFTMILVTLVAVALIALLGGILGKKTTRVGKETREEAALRCSYDGTRLQPIYQVDALLHDGSTVNFCSIYCATRWFHENKDKVNYFIVVDEVTGKSSTPESGIS